MNDEIKNLKNLANKLKNEIEHECKMFEKEKDKWDRVRIEKKGR